MTTRRDVLRGMGAAVVGSAFPLRVKADLSGLTRAVSLGVIADLHQDIMHDAPARLDAFLAAMRDAEPDALLNLGDFAQAKDANQPLIDTFNDAHDTPLHVIGNHDTDGGLTRERCVEAYGMPGRYYTQDVTGLRVIALDGNDRGSPTYGGGYHSYVAPEQIEWLDDELAAADGPVLVASHQPLAGWAAVDNATDVQAVLTRHAAKVALAVNGHTHIDQLLRIGGVPYLHVNSASYFWVGGTYQHRSYPDAVHDGHPYIDRTCPYRDALFATLTLDPARGEVIVTGTATEWVGPSPDDLDYARGDGLPRGADDPLTPAIRERAVPVGDA